MYPADMRIVLNNDEESVMIGRNKGDGNPYTFIIIVNRVSKPVEGYEKRKVHKGKVSSSPWLSAEKRL
jgi:hypothetical protein